MKGPSSAVAAVLQGCLSKLQFAELSAVPPEVEWFANLTNPNTRRAYRSDVRGFMGFLGKRPVGDHLGGKGLTR